MKSFAVGSMVLLALGCQHFSYCGEPKKIINIERPVNFTRIKNACYHASVLQALIAIPTWRNYIINFPPQVCGVMNYDHGILDSFKGWIQKYSDDARKGNYRINLAMLEVCFVQNTIITGRLTDEADHFIRTLEDKFLGGITKRQDCGLFGPMRFSLQRYEKGGLSKRGDPESNIILWLADFFISARHAAGVTIKDVITKELQVGFPKKFTRIPDILCIGAYFSENYVNQDTGRLPEISAELRVPQDWIDTSVIRYVEDIQYRLKSVVWQGLNHLIAYVQYGDEWYMCDDLRSKCEEVTKKAYGEFAAGKLTGPMFPKLMFYERIEPVRSQQHEVLQQASEEIYDLHASLTLLGI